MMMLKPEGEETLTHMCKKLTMIRVIQTGGWTKKRILSNNKLFFLTRSFNCRLCYVFLKESVQVVTHLGVTTFLSHLMFQVFSFRCWVVFSIPVAEKRRRQEIISRNPRLTMFILSCLQKLTVKRNFTAFARCCKASKPLLSLTLSRSTFWERQKGVKCCYLINTSQSPSMWWNNWWSRLQAPDKSLRRPRKMCLRTWRKRKTTSRDSAAHLFTRWWEKRRWTRRRKQCARCLEVSKVWKCIKYSSSSSSYASRAYRFIRNSHAFYCYFPLCITSRRRCLLRRAPHSSFPSSSKRA